MKRNKMKIIIPKESKLDLNSLSDSLDIALKNETKESLTEWLNSKRKETTLEEREPYWDLVDKKAEQNNTIDLFAYANGVQDGVKWQQERMYSEEELKSAFKIGFNIGYGSPVQELDLKNEHCERWLSRFKKK